MKIKIFYFLFFLLFNSFYFSESSSEEQFNFNVTEIEILDNGNIIKGLNKGTVTTNTGLEINANLFIYFKKRNVLSAEGNVKVFDFNRKIEIYAKNIIYDKNKNLIVAKGNVKTIDLVKKIEVNANEINFNQNDNILIANGNVKSVDKINDNSILADEIIYYKNIQEIKSKGVTTATTKDIYQIDSKNIIYEIKKNTISSKFRTKITDKNNQVFFLDKFNYYVEKKLLKGEKILFITNYNLPKSDKLFFENGVISLSDSKFLGTNPEIYIHKDIFDNSKNDPRLLGVTAEGNGDITNIYKGIFTSCGKGNKCPPWSIKASKIKHDKKKKQISYENAILNIYDFPVLYFPKFFHPDPTVKRQSGFLQPELNSSNILGSSLTIPYYKNLSQNKDFTFRPTWFDNKILMSNSEFRQINKNSKFLGDFGFVKNYKSSTTKRKKNLSHFFGKYDLDLDLENFNSSDLSISVQRVSNDNYLKIFETHITKSALKPSSFTTLNNNLKIFLDHNNYYMESGIEVFQKLKSIKSDQYQYILPYYNFNRSIPWKIYDGNFNFSSHGTNDLNETNSLKTKIINNLDYNNNIMYNLGLVSDIDIYLKNINLIGKKATNYKSSPESELISLFNFNLSLPLIKETDSYSNFLTPKVLFKINPNNMKDSSSSTNTINVDNIFSSNRLGLSDTFESGRSVTIGIDYKKENNFDEYFEFKLATSFRDKEENLISSKSSLNSKNSNLFGAINSQLSKKIKFGYNFSVDNNYSTLEYNDFNASFSLNNIITGFSFIEENGKLGDTNVLSGFFNYNLNEKNSLKFQTRRNRKINLTEYYDLVYEYKNDCLTAGIKYNKTYYSDGDIKPTENLLFTITLIPLTSYEYSANEILDR